MDVKDMETMNQDKKDTDLFKDDDVVFDVSVCAAEFGKDGCTLSADDKEKTAKPN